MIIKKIPVGFAQPLIAPSSFSLSVNKASANVISFGTSVIVKLLTSRNWSKLVLRFLEILKICTKLWTKLEMNKIMPMTLWYETWWSTGTYCPSSLILILVINGLHINSIIRAVMKLIAIPQPLAIINSMHGLPSMPKNELATVFQFFFVLSVETE